MDKFQELVSEKAHTLRRSLERVSATLPLAGRLLESMREVLKGMEEGSITAPYDISQWRIYVGGDYEMEASHPDVSEAFAALELVLDHNNLEAYLRTWSMLEELAKRHKPARS